MLHGNEFIKVSKGSLFSILLGQECTMQMGIRLFKRTIQRIDFTHSPIFIVYCIGLLYCIVYCICFRIYRSSCFLSLSILCFAPYRIKNVRYGIRLAKRYIVIYLRCMSSRLHLHSQYLISHANVSNTKLTLLCL